MSQQEFERYLSQLCRGLKLTSRQRAQISDELRDHLEERLEELAGAGVARDQAALLALEEFGDASILAGRLTAPARLKRGRLLARLSLSSVAVLVIMFCTSFNVWSEKRPIEERPDQGLAEIRPQPQSGVANSAETANAQHQLKQTKAVERAVDVRKIPVESKVADEHPLNSNSSQNRKT